MAFIDPNHRVRREIPDEPGQWVELRPLSTGDYGFAQRGSMDMSPAEIAVVLLSRAITAWSYPREVSVNAINDLEIHTFQWLRDEMQLVTGGRTDDEKKGSEPESSPTTAPDEDDSPENSGT